MPATSQSRPGNREIAEVVAAFQRGVDREANFEWLVERFYRPVYHFLSRWTPSEDDRLDLTQEVFFKVYKNLRGFRNEATFGSWVFKIAHNTCMRWLTRTYQAGSHESLGPAESEGSRGEAELARAAALLDDPLDHLIARESIARLREAIADLPPQMRRCVQLQIDFDLRLDEIAAILRLTPGAVKAHLFQAREKLRQRLRGPLAGERST
ncbi:MAG TPA: sigma-70 family RNA polymerase sigma factor [Thermoanaerobaculia bacterium]|jgi:RNA polymerase sigma-70 factor (ECF subfamily)|nr:sigma-70 family RNA polymerase sigma factor [Thermoanaerobaculia bacterium]